MEGFCTAELMRTTGSGATDQVLQSRLPIVIFNCPLNGQNCAVEKIRQREKAVLNTGMNPLAPGSQGSTGTICPRCKTTKTVPHNGGQWCPTCGAFASPPDPRHTAHIDTAQSEGNRPFLDLQAEAERLAAAPRCWRCQQPVDIGSGVYDDGEWLCGNCIAGFAR